MKKTLDLFEKALKSDPEYKSALTVAVDILWDAYNMDGGDRMFDAMVQSLKTIEGTFKR